MAKDAERDRLFAVFTAMLMKQFLPIFPLKCPRLAKHFLLPHVVLTKQYNQKIINITKNRFRISCIFLLFYNATFQLIKWESFVALVRCIDFKSIQTYR